MNTSPVTSEGNKLEHEGKDCCVNLDDENHVVRKTAAQVEEAAKKARCIGLALLGVGVACMMAAAGFSGYTAIKAKEQSQFNERLNKAIAQYQFEHADQAQQSFKLMQDAMRCSNLEFAKAANGLGALDPVAIASCFSPPPAAPPPLQAPQEKGPR